MAAHVPDDDGGAGGIRGGVSRLIAALLVVFLAERFLDVGVIAALALATLFLRRGWVAAVLPLAGWVAADPEWRTTTIALYVIFAAIAGFRNNVHAAAAALLVAFVELLRS